MGCRCNWPPRRGSIRSMSLLTCSSRWRHGCCSEASLPCLSWDGWGARWASFDPVRALRCRCPLWTPPGSRQRHRKPCGHARRSATPNASVCAGRGRRPGKLGEGWALRFCWSQCPTTLAPTDHSACCRSPWLRHPLSCCLLGDHKGSPLHVSLLSARARKFALFAAAASGWTSTAPQAAEPELAFLPDHQQHTGVEDRRVGTTKDTDQQRERKVADGYATKERQRTQCDQYGQRCVERAGHGLYQAGVDYLLKCLRGAALHVLTDTVEHNDCIVHRETDHRQQRGDEQRVDLDMKSPAQD